MGEKRKKGGCKTQGIFRNFERGKGVGNREKKNRKKKGCEKGLWGLVPPPSPPPPPPPPPSGPSTLFERATNVPLHGCRWLHLDITRKNAMHTSNAKIQPSIAICFFALIASKRTLLVHKMVSAAQVPNAFMAVVSQGRVLGCQVNIYLSIAVVHIKSKF